MYKLELDKSLSDFNINYLLFLGKKKATVTSAKITGSHIQLVPMFPKVMSVIIMIIVTAETDITNLACLISVSSCLDLGLVWRCLCLFESILSISIRSLSDSSRYSTCSEGGIRLVLPPVCLE